VTGSPEMKLTALCGPVGSLPRVPDAGIELLTVVRRSGLKCGEDGRRTVTVVLRWLGD
jgi:hypothetical protein